MELDFLRGPLHRTVHRGGDDDLVSAGLGLAGLAGRPVPFLDADGPTAAELRRRAIQAAWKGIADLGPLGGYGSVYGAVPAVSGREYSAFAHVAAARQPHRVLCQVPDSFDHAARCLVVGPSSGSRGVYGAAALAGAWGLAHGCAVAYTDKGGGTGYFDCADGSGVALDGTRAVAGAVPLDFEPGAAPADAGIAVKHTHSGDHPEADWGRHVLQAVAFGLAMLDEAFPVQAPFTPDNTRIIAVGVSNGGAAVLQAAGLDHGNWLDGVVALEPNVHVPERGRALYDYASEAALWMPAALTAACFANVPFARVGGAPLPAWVTRRINLEARGLLRAAGGTAPAEEALVYLHTAGWRDVALATAAILVTFDLWRGVAATYASAYLRTGVGEMPCGFSFHPLAVPGASAAAVRAAWWADGTGIPPHPGIGLLGGTDVSSDPTLPGVLGLRSLWDDAACAPLHASVAALAARLPRAGLPIWLLHGEDDGLIPAAFTSDAYADWMREHGRTPRYWRVPHAQHFDAFLSLPGFGDRYVPLLPYAYLVLDQMHAHVVHGTPLPDWETPRPKPRGANALQRAGLDLPA